MTYRCKVCKLEYLREMEVIAHIKKIHGVRDLWEYIPD